MSMLFNIIWNKGFSGNIDPSVFDTVYKVETGKIQFQGDIDIDNHDIKNIDNLSVNDFIFMNNNQIKNLQDGNEDNDAANIKQLNKNESNIQREMTTLKNEISNQIKNAIDSTIDSTSFNNYFFLILDH